MMPPSPDPSRPLDVAQGRRRTLALLVNTTIALLGGAFSALLGVFAIRPTSAAARERWIRAGTLAELTAHVPVPRVLAVPRADGWYRARSRETVFLVWDGARQVRVFSATCSHLGCQVLWDGKDKKFRCPCHGGVYDANGQVVDGPPPRPLTIIDARIEGGDDTVLVKV
jgi:quinol---cytochrome c reductase iron-sulfur subunit, bacillus type